MERYKGEDAKRSAAVRRKYSNNASSDKVRDRRGQRWGRRTPVLRPVNVVAPSACVTLLALHRTEVEFRRRSDSLRTGRLRPALMTNLAYSYYGKRGFQPEHSIQR